MASVPMPALLFRACLDCLRVILTLPRSSQQVPGPRCRLLSEAADALSGEQLGQLERDANGYPVKLLDVARGFDVAGLLSAWEGSFTVSD
jgi:hypothetical protein